MPGWLRKQTITTASQDSNGSSPSRETIYDASTRPRRSWRGCRSPNGTRGFVGQLWRRRGSRQLVKSSTRRKGRVNRVAVGGRTGRAAHRLPRLVERPRRGIGERLLAGNRRLHATGSGLGGGRLIVLPVVPHLVRPVLVIRPGVKILGDRRMSRAGALHAIEPIGIRIGGVRRGRRRC